ncbi:restriction endonuclease PLD domain-containing protein [Vibrio jasicida]|uniref:restriction endonuclease PLD domain-containing protein n=1 Tax=Vibrio jasicida TaxID=766224 RepID=UPI00391D5486
MMLVRNDNKEHTKILKEMLDNAQDVYIAVAFLKLSGLELIKENLEKILDGNGNINLIVGLDLYVTEPKALYELFDLCQLNTKLKVFLYSSKNSTFHPKMYASRRNDKSSVLIGSANLTNGGLSTNVEASIYNKNDVSLFEECKDFFCDLTLSTDCKKASALTIQEYEQQYLVFNKEVEKAERTSKQKIDNLAETSLLKECYKEYCNDKNEMHSLAIKRSNYREAKLLIEEFNTDSVKSKSDFMRVYEKLVGAAGQEKLWHSGSIFRSKNKVAESYQEFLKFTSFVSSDSVLSKKPQIVFEQVIPVKKKILGLGFNVITELLNTLEPEKFPVLNKNPIGSVKYLLGEEFKEPGQFKSQDYQAYAEFMGKLRTDIGAKDFIETDHFLNFVYWKYARNKT